jgi:hypothetical protein
MVTYKLLLLASILNPDVRLTILIEDGEGEVLDVSLHFRVGELATDETLCIENTGETKGQAQTNQ